MATPTTLPSTFSAGAVLTAAQMNNLRGAFRIMQVVFGSTSTEVATSSTTYSDSNLSATITPSDTNSKILVLVSQQCFKSSGNASNGVNLRLVRGSTTVQTWTTNLYTNSTVEQWGMQSLVYLDSPASTSALTYKTQVANFVAAAEVAVQRGGRYSSIILAEVSA